MNNLKDKIKGAICGYAVGDALGLGAEFMTREEVASNYVTPLSDYSQMINDAHRSMRGRGNYSYDTSIMFMLLDSIMDNEGVNPDDFAARLYHWYQEGQYDIPPQLRMVLSHPDYHDRPRDAAEEVWRKLSIVAESNYVLGAAMTSGLVTSDFRNETRALINTISHGPRAVGSSLISAEAASRLIRNDIITPERVLEIGDEFSSHIRPFVDIAADPDPDAMLRAEIDHEDSLWLITKTLCCALHALWQFKTFEEGLIYVINLGGDADTNGAAAGMLLGLRYGLSNIPQNLIEGLQKREKVEKYADRFADYVASHQ